MSMAYQPKSYRKFLAGTVSAAVVASAIAPVASASFTDVAGSVHANDIATLVAKGYIKGYADGTFKPGNSLTRGEAAIIFSRILKDAGVKAPEQGAGFPDVPASKAELAEAVAIVKAAGVMGGDEKGNFNPNANITREQMAKVVVEAFKLTKPANYTTKVTDLDKAGAWAREYIQVLEANGVTKNTEFAPKQNVTRGQFASFVVRAMDVKKEVSAADITAVKLVDEKTLEVTFNGELKEVKKEDFAIQGVEIESVSIKAAAAAEAKTTVVVIKTKTALEEGKSYSVSYKGQTTDKAKVDVPVVTPKVESVSAINAIQIEVKFNKPVDEKTATDLSNYKLDDVQLQSVSGALTDKATLSKDKKTVTLTLSKTGALANNKAYSLSVEGVKDANGNEIEKFVTSFIQKDDTKPTVTSVEAKAGTAGTKTIKVKFNEPLKTAGVYTIDGQSVAVSALNAQDYSKNNEVTLTTNNVLEAGKEYTLTVASATDHANNATVTQTVKFTVVADTTEGKLVSATAIDENHVKLTFDKEINPNTIPTTLGTNFAVDKVGGSYTGSTVTIDPDDSRSLIVQVGNGSNPGYSSTVKSIDAIITIDGLKDIYGNKIAKVDAVKVTLTKDEVAPKFVKATVSDDNKFVVVELSEEVLASSVTNTDATALKVLNKDGVNVTNDVFGTGQAFDRAVISKADGSAVDAGATKSKYIKFYNAAGNTIKEGTYTVQLAKDAFTDTSLAGNKSEALNFTITVNPLDNKVLPTVPTGTLNTSALAADKSQSLIINFGTAMNSTALNVNNYTINGQALPRGTTIEFTSTAKDTVKITFPAGAFAETKAVDFAVFNVQNSAGKAIASEQVRTLNVKDNTVPTITSAVANDDGTITLTFSEVVTTTSGTNTVVLKDNSGNVLDGTSTAAAAVGKTVVVSGLGLAGVDLANAHLEVTAGAFTDSATLTNETIRGLTITDKYVTAPTGTLTQVGTAQSASDYKVNISNLANLRTEGVTSFDFYVYNSTGAITKTNVGSYTASVAGVSINAIAANGDYTLPSTVTKDAKTGAALAFNGTIYVTVVARDANGNVVYSSELSAVSDYTAPTVNLSKFTAVDNASPTQDKLQGAASAVGEAGATVKAYLWTDANSNNTVDAGELGTAITLGTSAADGSVAAADIGDLPAGTYKFVITATDAAGNESAKTAAAAVTITLAN